jgi:NitT/TauT family transport system permease protein
MSSGCSRVEVDVADDAAPVALPPPPQEAANDPRIRPRFAGDSWTGAGLFLALLGGWELLVRGLHVDPLLLPPPSDVAISLWRGMVDGALLRHFGVTLFEATAGFALGAGSGLALGGLIALSPRLEGLLYPYLVALQTVPKVALAPLLVVWFGYGVGAKVVITASIAMFPVLAGTIAGLRSVPADQLELMAALQATRRQLLWKLRVPHALPDILVGLDVAAVLAVVGAVVGEFVSARQGLGFQILQAGFALDTAGLFAALVLLALIGVAAHLAMRGLRRRLLHWLPQPGSLDAGG